jgi:hypothetical protein
MELREAISACALGLIAQLLELAACPSDDVGIDPLEKGRSCVAFPSAGGSDPERLWQRSETTLRAKTGRR